MIRARSGELAPGDRVVLSGLKTTSLNGVVGDLVEFDMESGRWRVTLPDGDKAIKPENLTPMLVVEPIAAPHGTTERAPPPVGTTVFVGNLAWQASWQDLKDHFRTVGEVTHAEVILVPGTTRSKGCGHVTFANASDAATAISTLNDTVICHRMIFVREVIYNDNGTEILCRLSGDGRTATA